MKLYAWAISSGWLARTLSKNTVVLPYCDVREKEDDDVALFPFRRHLEGQSKITREITWLQLQPAEEGKCHVVFTQKSELLNRN